MISTRPYTSLDLADKADSNVIMIHKTAERDKDNVPAENFPVFVRLEGAVKNPAVVSRSWRSP